MGLALPAGLMQGDMTFSYNAIGQPTAYADVTIIPEPSTIAMLGVLGALGLLAYGWRRRNV